MDEFINQWLKMLAHELEPYKLMFLRSRLPENEEKISINCQSGINAISDRTTDHDGNTSDCSTRAVDVSARCSVMWRILETKNRINGRGV